MVVVVVVRTLQKQETRAYARPTKTHNSRELERTTAAAATFEFFFIIPLKYPMGRLEAKRKQNK